MNIIVIGGGAAGLMAAGTAAEQGANVTLFETNEKVGRKLFITGKGRCNVCNDCDAQEVLRNVPVNPRFLYSALGAFSPADVKAFFEEKGVALKTERGNRVFPVSDRASDIIDALFLWVRRTGVSIIHASVSDLIMQDGRVTGVRAGKKTCLADRVIVATGGASYPQTGSTGDGYRFAREAGHSVVPANPSLVPLVESGETCRSLMGLSLRNVQLTVFENEKKIYTDFGEMLFTHFGLSGPLVLSASAHMRHFGSKSYRVEIDLKPALDEKTLDKRLLSDFDKHKNSDFVNALGELLPRKIIPAVIEKSGIDPREKVNTITKKQRASLLRVLKCFPVEISGKRPIAEAIVTTGGVSVREVSPKTMESKKCSGLYFAGEVLDVDAYTGGFNLQIAWSTGRTGGEISMKYISVAIDGPSGAGKSTVARAAAAQLGYVYVDTGAMYRTIGLAVCRRGISGEDTEGIRSVLPDIRVGITYENGAQHVLLNGEDVSSEIRTPEIAYYASRVSAVPEVREFLLNTQRDMAKNGNILMDGRDIGTVILPDAPVKIFLTASAESRAERRYKELAEKGQQVTMESVLHDINERDRQDMNRAIAPLRQAEDAVLLDTSALTLEESIASVLRIIREKTEENK